MCCNAHVFIYEKLYVCVYYNEVSFFGIIPMAMASRVVFFLWFISFCCMFVLLYLIFWKTVTDENE